MPFDDFQEVDETTTPAFRSRAAYLGSEPAAPVDDGQVSSAPSGLLYPDEQLRRINAQFTRQLGVAPQAAIPPTIGQRILALGQNSSFDRSANERSAASKSIGERIMELGRQRMSSPGIPRLSRLPGTQPKDPNSSRAQEGLFGTFVPSRAGSTADSGETDLQSTKGSTGYPTGQDSAPAATTRGPGNSTEGTPQLALPGSPNEVQQRRTLSRAVRGIRGSAPTPEGTSPSGTSIIDLTNQVNAPSRIPRQYDSGDYFSNVNDDVIVKNEGGSLLQGYVPRVRGGPDHSGVTVAAGFDLGQHSTTDLRNLGLSKDLVEKLSPYLGLTGQEARDALVKSPLVISSDEATEINTAAFKSYFDQAGRAFNQTKNNLAGGRTNADVAMDPDGNAMEFSKLPWQVQTAIADLWYNMGDLRVAAPQLWNQVTTGDWEGAYQNLRNFTQIDTTLAARARGNAKLLRDAIDMGAIADY